MPNENMDGKLKLWLKLMEFGARLGCHQIAERSFFIRGFQFPLCARCTGLLAGYIGAVFLYNCAVMPYWVYGILILPMAIDGITQYVGWRESVQLLRFITGLLGGYGLLSIQIDVIVKLTS